MKHTSFKRLLALLLSIVMAAAVFAAVIPVSAASEISIQNGSGTRSPIRVGKAYSYRAKVNGEFTAFGYCMPTWTKPNSYATLYLYKWQGSYEKTVKSTPVASKVFNPLKDGQYHWVEFDPQPAGEYLFHIADGGADVGVWTNTGPSDSKGFLYLDGLEQRGEPELKIRFTDAPAEPFGNCEPSGDIRSIQTPYAGQADEGVMNMNSPLGLRLNVTAPITGVQFKMATYMATDMEIDMSVYAWKGTYDKTIAEKPVVTERVKLVDNAMQGINFDEIPAGDYLFLTENFNKAPAMYVYKTMGAFKGYVYKDGFPWTTGVQYPVMQVVFSEEKEDYFVECSKPEDTITGDHVAPPAYVIPEDSLIYTHPVMPDTWVFTDGLGRVSLTNADVGDLRADKTLAMFYWTWHIDGFVTYTPANLQELSEKYPEAMRDWDNQLWNDKHTFWWNESIYGFYRGDDKWVLRKQAELLANAGVDVIFTDNTNAEMTWRNAYTPLMEEWTDAMNDGLKAPKVSFMLPFWDKAYTNTQVQSLYLDIYRAGKFQNLWFYWDEKPMLMGMRAAFNAANSPIEKEISRFFTFRSGQPSYVVDQSKISNASWGWLGMYPQNVYYANKADQQAGIVEQITVGIAQNHDYEKGLLAAMSGNTISGRSYTSTYKDRYAKEGAEASKWGYNFAEQWSRALEIDPKVVFVTGWNEFRVGRYETWPEGSASAVENAFPDTYNDEFSRDIEPTKGALQDHYYYQLVNFVRRYKGARPIPTPSKAQTIDLNAGYDQWKTVEPYFGAYIGNTEHRNAPGYGDLVYTETSGRNDIIGAQVARDGEYIYFLVECAEDITPYTDALWMNLYIDCDQSKQGWNTFDYVVSKGGATENTMTLEKFTGDNSFETEHVGEAEYKVDGRYLTVKIEKAALELSGNDFTVNFTWTDNVHDEDDALQFSGDILDFYISGDVAPGGRFKYSYVSTAANTGDVPTTDTQPTVTDPADPETPTDPTDTPTEAPDGSATDAPATDAPDGSETEAPKGGCRSALGSIALMMIAGAAVVVWKKKD